MNIDQLAANYAANWMVSEQYLAQVAYKAGAQAIRDADIAILREAVKAFGPTSRAISAAIEQMHGIGSRSPLHPRTE